MDEDYGTQLANYQADRAWEDEHDRCIDCNLSLDDCFCWEDA